jgi:O-antigen/teichoic acid export membrane protein
LVSLPYYPLRGRDDFLAWNALRIAPPLPWIAILSVAWVFSCRDPQRLALAYLIGLALLFFPSVYVVRRRIPGKMQPDMQKFGPLLHYGLPCMMTTLPQTLNFRLDQMLMTGLLPPTQLGLYVVAVAWSGMISPLLNAISAALFPRVAMEAQEGKQARAFAQGSRLGVLTAVTAGALLMSATPWGMLLLFGKGFRAAVSAGLILVPAGAVAGLNTVLEAGLRGLGRPASVMQAEFAGLGITAIALALLLRPMGIIGASVASLLGYSTVCAVLLVQAHWQTGALISELLLPRSREIYLSVMRLRLLAGKLVSVPDRA